MARFPSPHPAHRRPAHAHWSWLVRLWLCLWLALPLAATATAPAPVTAVERLPLGLSLAGRLAVLPDTGAPVAALQALLDSGAHQVPPGPLRSEPGQGARWLRAELAHSGTASDWLLAFPSTAIHRIELHGPYDAEGRLLAPPQLTGMALPYASRPLQSERYALPLHLPGPGRYTVWLKVQADTSQNLTPALWHPTDFLVWRQHKRLFDGVCYGILLALLVYNLSLALALRDATYGHYVLACGFALLTLASFNGHAAHYLWPELPWLIERANVLMPALWIATSALFARRFLDTPHMAPRLDRVLLGYSLAAIATVGLGLLGTQWLAQTVNELLAFSGVLLMSVAGVRIWRQGFPPARWYLAGQASLFAGVIAVVLINWGQWEAPFLEANGLQIGVSLELVVFALALSARVRLLQRRQLALERQTRELARSAASDSLTGVANRRGLLQQAEALLQQPQPHALLLLDLDRFKPINDTHGHEVGDRVLQVLAQRMQAQLRDSDLVARLGGDEFVIVLSGDADDEALAHAVRRLHHALAQPMVIDDLTLRVETSVGIARHPRDGDDLQSLLRAADLAMYRAKRSRSRFAIYQRGSDDTPNGGPASMYQPL